MCVFLFLSFLFFGKQSFGVKQNVLIIFVVMYRRIVKLYSLSGKKGVLKVLNYESWKKEEKFVLYEEWGGWQISLQITDLPWKLTDDRRRVDILAFLYQSNQISQKYSSMFVNLCPV